MNGMYLRTIQASALKTIFEVLKDIINDVNVYFEPTGIRILTLDTARVTLIHMTMPAENFEEYDFPSEIIAGLNMANTYKLLKSVTSNDSLTLRINDRDVLEIDIENTVKHSKTSFKLKLMDINEDILEVPEIQMNLVTTVPSIDFQRITRDMANLSSNMSVFRQGETLELSCQGDFADQTTILECNSGETTTRVGNVFSLKYINMFTKATNLCSNVQILQDSENSEMPIVFRYSIANLGDVKFFLAPKVDV
jgi:proliferating cell nuclear antigen